MDNLMKAACATAGKKKKKQEKTPGKNGAKRDGKQLWGFNMLCNQCRKGKWWVRGVCETWAAPLSLPGLVPSCAVLSSALLGWALPELGCHTCHSHPPAAARWCQERESRQQSGSARWHLSAKESPCPWPECCIVKYNWNTSWSSRKWPYYMCCIKMQAMVFLKYA